MKITLELSLEEVATFMLWYASVEEKTEQDEKLYKRLEKQINGTTIKSKSR